MIFIFCGFMGAGKSYLADRLAKSGVCVSKDLDAEIFERHAQKNEKSLATMIERRGWDAFRRMELDVLQELFVEEQEVATARDLIVSLGGGAWRGDTLNFVKTQRDQAVEVYSVWLQTSFETCWQRIKGDGSRPLVSLGQEKLAELYAQREMLYQLADLALNEQQQRELKSCEQLHEMLQNGKN